MAVEARLVVPPSAPRTRSPWGVPGRRPVRRLDRDDRRPLRRVAGGLSLLLALYCLVMAALTLGAALPAPAAAGVPVLIPVIWLVFLIVLGAVVRRPGRRPESSLEPSRLAHSP